MVTRDDLEQLVKNRGQDAVGAAVVKIPDEDVRPALMLMVMIYQKSDEINREIFRRDQKRIAELEDELEKARAELHRLEQEKQKSFILRADRSLKLRSAFYSRQTGAWAKCLLPKRDFTGSEAVSLLLIFQGFDSYST